MRVMGIFTILTLMIFHVNKYMWNYAIVPTHRLKTIGSTRDGKKVTYTEVTWQQHAEQI